MKRVLYLALFVSCAGFVWSGGSSESSMGEKTIGESSMGGAGKDAKAMGGMESMGSAPVISVSEGEGFPVTITDRLGNRVTFEEKPENVAVVSAGFLDLFYDLGGKSVCTTEIKGNTPVDPEAIVGLPVVGQVYRPDIEAIIGLQPSLVLAQFGLQNSLVEGMNQSHIPILMLHMRTYDDVLVNLRALGRMIGADEKANAIITGMEKDKNAITDKLPGQSKKIVILYATSKDVSVKLPNSIAGNVADILGLTNIAAGATPEGMGGETTPFSMEYIVAQDPDEIFVTSMLSNEEMAREIISKQFSSDPVWMNLRAVKENQITYLPQKYFLYNAGTDFVDAIEFMAQAVYPEIYGN